MSHCPDRSRSTASGAFVVLGAMAVAGLGLVSACSNSRATLLQVDVSYPPGLSFTRLQFSIGGTETRTWARPAPGDGVDGAAAPSQDAGGGADGGVILGVDMLLPRGLVGQQWLVVRALDATDCTVGSQSMQLELRAGQRIEAGVIALLATQPPACEPAPLDAGADTAGERAAGADARVDVAGDRAGGADTRADVAGDRGGGADARGDLAGDGAQDRPAPPQACQLQTDCPSGKNCVVGTCQDGAATCAELTARDPALGDGVYWLAPAGVAARAYCDMQQKTVLCTETAGDHTGRTRDATHLTFTMRSILELTDGRCKIWAVRDMATGDPLDYLVDRLVSGAPSKTCATLGFKADVSLGACPFGANPGYTDCGFGLVKPFYYWGNVCDCGTMPNFYEREGAIYVSNIPWNVSGTIFSRCAVR